MTNITILHDKKHHLAVHEMVGSGENVHKRSGLWICSYTVGGRTESLQKWDMRVFDFFCISHLIEGKGALVDSAGQRQEFHPGQAVIVQPGFVHRYGGYHSYYVEDAICFCGALARLFSDTGILRNGIFNLGKGRPLEPIIQLARDPSDLRQIEANFELQKLILDFHSNSMRQQEDRYGLYALIEQINKNPQKWWTVTDMAETCCLSSNQFRRVFLKHTGLTPKNYVERLKIKAAGEMLFHGNMTVEEIARKLGYRDQFHFSRRFKIINGYSPTIYRQKMATH